MFDLFHRRGTRAALLFVASCAVVCHVAPAQSLRPVRIGDKYGYVDLGGKLVIPAQFDGASWFADGLARIETGVVKKGRTSDHSNSRYGFVDEKGKVRIAARFDFAHDFSDGLAVIKVDRRYGYVDTTGKVVIEPRFPGRVGDFHEGRAWVVLGKGTLGFLDKTGKIVFRVGGADTSGPRNFSQGLCKVELQKGGIRFYDKDGKIAFTPDCDFAASFHEGLARARKDKVWGYLDLQGKWAIEPRFQFAGHFSGPFGIVNKDGKSLYIKRDGTQAFSCDGMERLGAFHEELAMVKDAAKNKFGFIDTSGKWVIEAKWDDPQGYGYFQDGIARVADKSRGRAWRGYIDRTGKLVWPKAK